MDEKMFVTGTALDATAGLDSVKDQISEKELDASAPVPGMSDISQMTDMVCSFVLTDGRKKTFPFSMVYMALTVAFLGMVLRDGVLIVDDDATLARNFGIPEVERLQDYQSMQLAIQFMNGGRVTLNLTPTQIFILVGKFEFDVTDKSGVFTCLSDLELRRLYLREPAQKGVAADEPKEGE